MIHILILHNEEGEFVSCKVQGHARYAKAGNDVVCAAVSILARTLVLQLDEWASLDRGFEIDIDCRSKAYLSVRVLKSGKKACGELLHIFSFISLGFRSLADEFPDNVKLECGLEKNL